MRSKRTVAARCINGACLMAQHVADAAIQLYPTDSAAARYQDMPAVWDWHSLPGITADRAAGFFPCDPKVCVCVCVGARGGTITPRPSRASAILLLRGPH